ncbi:MULTISPECIES: hypothetical protein [unclassified Nonomuraea]|uniref:hypothetical protein n=1 Tax=unclassified Nonomuraea TaxID=2593643 RepID=UPI0033E15607
MTALHGSTSALDEAGVTGDSAQFHGVLGMAGQSGASGVAGVNENGGDGVSGQGHNGVNGRSRTDNGAGVMGHSSGVTGSGVLGVGESGHGVLGVGKGGAAGVKGINENPSAVGVLGQGHVGVWGQSLNEQGFGVFAFGGEAGVLAFSNVPSGRGVDAISDHGPGIYAQGSPAGMFQGDVRINGALNVQNVDVLGRISAVEQALTSAAQQQMVDLKQQHAADVQRLTEAIAALTARVAALES